MPISSSTAMAKLSSSVGLTPTESRYAVCPYSRLASASAIGERMALWLQANSTLAGKPLMPRRASCLDVQGADQGEEAPRRVEVDLDLAGEPLAQKLRALVVQTAAAHVER